MNIHPPYLKEGDNVLLVSPSGNISSNEIYPAVKMLEDWGLQVKISKYAFDKYYIFSGNKEKRIHDFQLALDDKNINAIICNRGGYGAIHLLGELNFRLFKQVPKWVVGYSDITVFHAFLNSIVKCESIHGIMPAKFPVNGKTTPATETLRKALFGETIRYQIDNHKFNRYGKTSGELIGGNLSIINSLIGTAIGYLTKGKILFIEEIGENLYHIDRMMHHLKLSGKLSNLNGLVVGGMTEMKNDPLFGKTAYKIISETVKEYSYPVVFNFPAGHLEKNLALHFGQHVLLKVTSGSTIMVYKDRKKRKNV